MCQYENISKGYAPFLGRQADNLTVDRDISWGISSWIFSFIQKPYFTHWLNLILKCHYDMSNNKMVFPLVPDIILPMDDIQGSVLQGTITGIVGGGANIVASGVGGALHLNGVDQNVNFGQGTSTCFYTFQECPDGVTWAMWLKLEGEESSTIIDAGLIHTYAMGYRLRRSEFGGVRIEARNTTHWHFLNLKYWELGYWVHLAFSLHPTTGGAMYLNGCRVTDSFFRYNVITRSEIVPKYFPFVLGSNAWGRDYAAMGIDNLLIWYNILAPENAWKLYLQGGKVWIW